MRSVQVNGSRETSSAPSSDHAGHGESRKVPDMQVVTKGWWTLREQRRPVEELERQDRLERSAATR